MKSPAETWNAAIEKAAKVADKHEPMGRWATPAEAVMVYNIADAIRKLKKH